jgi:PAS domain-containing protein
MRRFVLRENIARYTKLLETEHDETMLRTIRSLLRAAQRQLALADAALEGVAPGAPAFSPKRRADRFQLVFESAPHPYLLLDPRAGLHIIDINDAYAQATMTMRKGVAGERMFDVFPDNPDNPAADGVSNLYASLRIAAETGKPHAMPVQRYDVRDPTGVFRERHWRPLNTPLVNGEGQLIYLLHHVEDVTAEVLAGAAAAD